MRNDRKRRNTWARVDTKKHGSMIDEAQSIIYEENRPVDCELVENLLKGHSYVPTKVNHIIHPHMYEFNLSHYRMLFQNASALSQILIGLTCLWWI